MFGVLAKLAGAPGDQSSLPDRIQHGGRSHARGFGYPVAVTLGAVDVLVLTALKEELDALLEVRAPMREPWVVNDGDPPLYVGVLDGRAGPIRVAAARVAKMGGVATATLAARLIETVKPACLAMCGVCAGQPEDTELGDVVIADRLFHHDEGKIRSDGFQGDLWVDALRDDWLRIAQDMAGPATQFDIYATPGGDDWKWWFLAHLAAGRDPLKSAGLRRNIPDDSRPEHLQTLRNDRLVTLKGKTFALTKAGRTKLEEHQVMRGTLVTAHPFHVLVGPMGSGNAVHAGGEIWKRLASGGMRKILAVEMEAAAIGRVAHERGLRFAVAKGVMDHAGPDKTDRFKVFAARASAEVLCRFLCNVVKSDQLPYPSALPSLVVIINIVVHGNALVTPEMLAEALGRPAPADTLYLVLTRELARSEINPATWQELATKLDALVREAEAIASNRASRCLVAGHAPLPVFAYLGQKMQAMTIPISFANLRRGEAVWELIDRPQVTAPTVGGRFTTTPPLAERDGALILAIMCSSRFVFEDLMAAPMIDMAGVHGVTTYKIITNASHLSDPLGRNELDQLIGHVEAALAWLADQRTAAGGLTVILAGPAWVAFWVGNRIHLNRFGDRVQFHHHAHSRYLPALSIPMRAAKAAPPETASTGTSVPVSPAPLVFISYSQESTEHNDAVRDLADKLRSEGVDAWIDRYVTSPPEGWPAWMRHQLVNANYVLLICTATYRRRFTGDRTARPTDAGKGVTWEALIASQLLYADRSQNHRFIPVMLPGATPMDIPVELQASTPYQLPEQYEELYRRIIGETSSPPPLGAFRAAATTLPIMSQGAPVHFSSNRSFPEKMIEGPSRRLKTALRNLETFFHRFEVFELRALAFFHGGTELEGAIPGSTASRNEVAHALAMALWQRNLLDDDFFADLLSKRPALTEEVAPIKKAILDPTESTVPRTPATDAVPNLGGPTTATAPGPPRPPAEPPPREEPESGPWSPEERAELERLLVRVLQGAPSLTNALDGRLAARGFAPVGPPPATHVERAARRILSLGRGIEAAQLLVEECCAAVMGEEATAAAEQPAARELVEVWLPRGYGGGGRVVVLTFRAAAAPRAESSTAKVSIDTLSPIVVEIQLACLDGRKARFATRRVDNDGHESATVEGRGRVPHRVSGSEILGVETVTQAIIHTVTRRYNLPTRTGRAMQLVELIPELEVHARLDGHRHYVAFSGSESRAEYFTDLVEQLHKSFNENESLGKKDLVLRIVALADEPLGDRIPPHLAAEARLLRWLERLIRGPLEDDDLNDRGTNPRTTG